ncbi:2-oxoglutarate (2OG) and Fe(II)-dependent oxygenase superfamily protein [Actinidia rufa]|uniref:procollagen-proline 4-dioxygenase n=1 Tax=Actinidia rufa TaxID=165716 RepID=A0A7J0EN77_9ERIC|nr:2-oxoglutarate (2OG) and Fe(II)-dependent oxygenase superfamily protein [Actinidia rufa]
MVSVDLYHYIFISPVILTSLPPPPPPPPPPLPKSWAGKGKTTDAVSVTNQEIAKFWRQKRIEEEDHLLAAIKAAARIRARKLTEDDYRQFEESLNKDQDSKPNGGSATTIITKNNCSITDENSKELRLGIKDWWTKSKYAYLNQPAIESMMDTPKRQTSSYIPNFCNYKPVLPPTTSFGDFLGIRIELISRASIASSELQQWRRKGGTRVLRFGNRLRLRSFFSLLIITTFLILILLALKIVSIPGNSPKAHDLSSIAHNTVARSDGDDGRGDRWVEVISWEPRAFVYHNFLNLVRKSEMEKVEFPVRRVLGHVNCHITGKFASRRMSGRADCCVSGWAADLAMSLEFSQGRLWSYNCIFRASTMAAKGRHTRAPSWKSSPSPLVFSLLIITTFLILILLALKIVSIPGNSPKAHDLSSIAHNTVARSDGDDGRGDYLPSCRRLLNLGMGAVRRNFAVQVTLCPLSCIGIAVDRCPSIKPWRSYPVELAIKRQLSNDACLSSDSCNVRSVCRSVMYYNSKDECEYLINLAKPQMQKSTVVDSSTGKSKDSRVRTSSGTFLTRGRDKIIRKIEKRIADFTFIPVGHGEGLQILHYEVGQKYDPHYDYFADVFNTKNGGQRIATVLMYLSDVEEGGETVFPAAKGNFSAVPWWNELSECGKGGLSVKPKMGDALLFWSMKPDASLDPSSLHGACPVIKGNKWSSTKWMHLNEYKV